METFIRVTGFWQRVAAFILDTIILFIVGFIVSLCMQNFLVSLGSYAVLVGFGLTVGYQTIFNSAIMNGQTLGKRAIGIKVTDVNGNAISVGRSLLRSLVLCIPFFLSKIHIPGIYDSSVIYIILATIFTAFVTGTFVFYILNTATRQCPHDLIAKTYVVELQASEEAASLKPIAPLPYIVTSVIVAAMLTVGLYIKTGGISGMDRLFAVADNMPVIPGATITEVSKTKTTSTSTGKGRSETYKYEVNIQVLTKPDGSVDEVTKQVVSTIFANDSDAYYFDVIEVKRTRGFDIGISSLSNSMTISKSPQAWLDIIDPNRNKEAADVIEN